MVEVKYRDRLGNNLFQYCMGRIIAEEMEYALKAAPLPGFSGTQQDVQGKRYNEPVHPLNDQKIDLRTIVQDASPRKVLIDGWFQRYEYYAPYRDRIRSWLAIDPAFRTPCTDSDLVVNIRRTDYIGLGWALPFSYYRDAIEQTLPKGGRLSIVTDDVHDPFFLRFRGWKPSFYRATPLQQMSYMANAPRLVMSASTFSWWSAFLGSHESVVCPDPTYGIWARTNRHDGVDLVDKNAFLCIDAPTEYIPNALEIFYQKSAAYRIRAAGWLKRKLKAPI